MIALKFLLVLTLLAVDTTLASSDSSDDDYDSDYSENNSTQRNHTIMDYTDEEDYDNDVTDELEECSALQVVKNLNFSDFLPDDYEQLKSEPMAKIVPHFDETWGRFERAFKWEHKLYFQKDLKELFQYAVGLVYEMTYDFNLDTECAVAVKQLFDGLIEEQIWAFKFLDSQAHPLPTGFWGGIISSFGEYDQCLDISHTSADGKSINGQYCMLRAIMPYPLIDSYDPSFEDNVFAQKLKNFTKKYGFDGYADVNPILKLTEYLNMRQGKFFEFGICIPDKCHPKDIEKEINRIVYPLLRIPVELNDTYCKVKDANIIPKGIDHYQKLSITLFAFMTTLVGLSTAHQLYNQYVARDGRKQNRVLRSFSALHSTGKLLATRDNDQFAAVNSVKLLVAVWFVAAHTYFFTAHSFVLKRFNYTVPLQLFYENRYFFVRAKQLGVDSFMLASGLLVCYKVMTSLDKSSGKFNYISYLAHKWLKLAVPLLAAILLYYLLPLVGSGPIWYECDHYFQPGCKDWSVLVSNFLFYSNFNILFGKYFFGICVHMTWFLSSNFQLCLLAPSLVIALHRLPRWGTRLTTMIILSSLLLIVSPYLLFESHTYYELTRLASMQALVYSIFNYHMNTLQYLCSFTIGIFTGYAIKREAKLSVSLMSIDQKLLTRIVTALSLTCLPLVMVWNNTLNLYNDSPSALNALLFFGLGKLLWSASLAWIWYVCCTGQAEQLNKMLSIKWMQPLAKLSCLIYLVHFPVIFYRIYSIRQTYIMTDWLTIQNIYIDVCITCVLSYVLHVLIVSPIESLIECMASSDCMSGKANVEDLKQVFATSDGKQIGANKEKLCTNL